MKKTRYQPNYTIPPGETLRETLKTIGMTQAVLADLAGCPKKTINEIVTARLSCSTQK